jgi:hypothetical protein
MSIELQVVRILPGGCRNHEEESESEFVHKAAKLSVHSAKQGYAVSIGFESMAMLSVKEVAGLSQAPAIACRTIVR